MSLFEWGASSDMLVIGGIVFVMVCVFGIYIMTGGSIEVVAHPAPHELGTIFGAGIGAYAVANCGPVIKKTFKDIGKAIKGPCWKGQDYKDLLSLMFQLCKLIKTKGIIAAESHIEKPHESALFSQYPRIAHDHFALDLITDTLRMMTMNFEKALHVEDHINRQLEKHHHESTKPGDALQSMADGLPFASLTRLASERPSCFHANRLSSRSSRRNAPRKRSPSISFAGPRGRLSFSKRSSRG